MVLIGFPGLTLVLECAILIVGFPALTAIRIGTLIFHASLIIAGLIIIIIIDAARKSVAIRIVNILADHLQLAGDHLLAGFVAAAVFQPFTRMAPIQFTIRVVLRPVRYAVFVLPFPARTDKLVVFVVFLPAIAAFFVHTQVFPIPLIIAGLIIIEIVDAAWLPVPIRIQNTLANQRQLAGDQVVTLLAARAVLQRLRPRALKQCIALIAIAVVPAVLRVFLLARFCQRTRRQQCQCEQAYCRPPEPSLHSSFLLTFYLSLKTTRTAKPPYALTNAASLFNIYNMEFFNQ